MKNSPKRGMPMFQVVCLWPLNRKFKQFYCFCTPFSCRQFLCCSFVFLPHRPPWRADPYPTTAKFCTIACSLFRRRLTWKAFSSPHQLCKEGCGCEQYILITRRCSFFSALYISIGASLLQSRSQDHVQTACGEVRVSYKRCKNYLTLMNRPIFNIFCRSPYRIFVDNSCISECIFEFGILTAVILSNDR